MRKCAILSMDSLADFEAYDYLVDEPLLTRGWQTELVSWRKQDVDWSMYDVVVIRTPWDYQDDMNGFLTVLETIEASSAHLENTADVVRWNINKIYLKSLEKSGVTIVPTLWPEQYEAQALQNYFTHFNTSQIVLKPRVSANADNTFWLKKENYLENTSAIQQAFNDRELMVQPFIASVCQEGEFSLFYFNGQYSHAILKTPADGDFRVQEEHGGRLLSITPEDELLRVANQTMQTITVLHGELLYARVDFVRHQNTFALMEAELIEPSLYFNMDEDSPERFAKAFVERIATVEANV